MVTIIFDLHGVLADTKLTADNYRLYLIHLFRKFGLSVKKAQEYHVLGLSQFFNGIDRLKQRNLSGKPFLQLMEEIDLEWDFLMQEPFQRIAKDHSEISTLVTSRAVELEAGKIRNVLFSDAQKMLQEWQNTTKGYSLVIASNAHSVHIKGIISGFDPLLDNLTLVGWNHIHCLKNHSEYFPRLKEYLTVRNHQEPYIMVGNSTEEIIGSKKEGFLPILINRDREVTTEALKEALKVYSDVYSFYQELPKLLRHY